MTQPLNSWADKGLVEAKDAAEKKRHLSLLGEALVEEILHGQPVYEKISLTTNRSNEAKQRCTRKVCGDKTGKLSKTIGCYLGKREYGIKKI